MRHYFAYGSNMLTARLQARVPSARPLGVASLEHHTMEFSKRSWVDGSGKCTIVPTDAPSLAWGVVYDMDPNDRPALDRAEGLGNGYEEREVQVISDGDEMVVFTYIVQPSHHEPGLVPWDWYLALVVAGAEEHGLPEDHVAAVRLQEAEPDPDRERAERMWALVGQR